MDIISNPITLGAIAATVAVLLTYLFIRRSRPITEVLLCRERDRSGERVDIEKDFAETMETSLNCKPVPMFFWKYRGGYTFHESGHIVRRSFAREGSAYTKDVETGNIIGTLSQALKSKVGDAFYNAIPETQRKQIEDLRVAVIVDLENPLTPADCEPMSSEDINAEGDRKASRIYNDEMKEEAISTKRRLVDVLLGFAVAAAIILLAVAMKWIPVTGGAPA